MKSRTSAQIASGRSRYISEAHVRRDLGESDIEKLGIALDDALGALAPAGLGRDDATLALLTIVESTFLNLGREAVDYDALVCPALDHIIPKLVDTTPTSQVSPAALRQVHSWLEPSEEYHAQVGAVIQCMVGTMQATELVDGRIVIYPASDFNNELRSRWFAQRWESQQLARGEAIVDDGEAEAVLHDLDRYIEANRAVLASQSVLALPDNARFGRYVESVVDGVLRLQFAHIDASEVWGGLSTAQYVTAIKPLYLRAARRLLAHQRAFKYAKERLGARAPGLVSCIEVVSIEELVAEVSATGIASPVARALVQSLMRTRGEERFRIGQYPLIPMSGNRVTYLPSSILFATWSMIRERAESRAAKGSSEAGKLRDRRHVDRLDRMFRDAGYGQISRDVKIFDSSTRRTLTDLDVVIVSEDRATVLVIQLKSFLTPGNLFDIERATGDVSKAVEQCRVADQHRDEVRRRVESALRLTLGEPWTLHQIIVVETFAGTEPVPRDYPVVSLEWLEGRLGEAPLPSLQALWHAAVELPDAATFLASVAEGFSVFGNAQAKLQTGTCIEIFGYRTK